MDGKKKVAGFIKNDWEGIGHVIGDPIFVPSGNDEYAFLTLECYTPELGENGQWAEVPMHVPLLCKDQGKVKTIKSWVKDGRHMHVRGYYKSWKVGDKTEHGIMVTYFRMGSSGSFTKEDDGAPIPPK